MSQGAITIVSGGMDSVTLAYYAKSAGLDQRIVSFNYGQRHARELRYAARCASDLGVPHFIVDLHTIRDLLPGSALTDGAVDVPDGHYVDATMKATVVPNRNAIMISIAYGIAVAHKCTSVMFGAHSGDHTIYPDCRPDFVDLFGKALLLGNAWADPPPVVRAPFVTMSKADIVKVGVGLGVPYERTWSCYKGGTVHCGTCGTCTERIEAFALAGVKDPTTYSQRVP